MKRPAITAEFASTIRPDVVVRLPYESAQVLVAIVGSIPGSDHPEIREHTDRLYDALNELGVKTLPSLNTLDVTLSL